MLIYISIIILILLILLNCKTKELFSTNVKNKLKTFDNTITESKYRKYYNILPEINNNVNERSIYLNKYLDKNPSQKITNNENKYYEHIDVGIKGVNKSDLSSKQAMINSLKDIEIIDYSGIDKNILNKMNLGNESDTKVINTYNNRSILKPAKIKANESKLTANSSNLGQFNQINLGSKYNFKSINDYHKYQLFKKKDKQYNFTNFKPYDEEHEKKLNDLYGEYHPVQQRTFSNIVSRGVGKNVKSVNITKNPKIYKEVYNETEKNKLKPIMKKECPIPFRKTYSLANLLQINTKGYDRETKRRLEKKYYKEIGGTERKGNDPLFNCQECDYPMGCLNYPDRDEHYEFKSNSSEGIKWVGCKNRQNRKCLKCKTCEGGEYFAERLCGEGDKEGGEGKDRKCKPCTPCEKDHYKVYGCDKDNSMYDNVCVKMTTCRGKDTINDPGEKSRTYMYKDGVRGSNSFKRDSDKGSKIKEINDIPPDPYMNSNKVIIQPKPRKKMVSRQTDIEGKILPNPYYGKDRQCRKCDICPTGFIHYKGCIGDNSVSNTVCQRQIDVEKYVNMNIDKMPGGKFFDREKLRREIENVNKNLIIHDDVLRNYFFDTKNGEYVGVKRQFRNKLSLSNLNDPQIYQIFNVSFDIRDYLDKNFNKYKLRYKANDYKYLLKNKRPYKFNDISELIPVIDITTLKEMATNTCDEYKKDVMDNLPSRNLYINKDNRGCNGDKNTIFMPKKIKCNDGEKMVSKGNNYSDITCEICSCPPDKKGINSICSGTQDDLEENNYKGITGCEDKKTCDTNIYFDKPDEYGDKNKNNICKNCNKLCPPKSYKIQDCIPGTNTNLICKPHRECDPETMITVKEGSQTRNTICQCIDGYDWPIDKITHEKDLDAEKCTAIKGECWKKPCNKNAICYDNFNDDGSVNSNNPYVCKCDTSKGYIETEDMGKGENGCILLPKNHAHGVNEKKIPDKFKKPEYKDINKNQFAIRKHLDSDFHSNMFYSHIHKSYSPS